MAASMSAAERDAAIDVFLNGAKARSRA